MKNLLLAGSMLLILMIPSLTPAEEQVRDSTGRVVEIRQSYGGTSATRMTAIGTRFTLLRRYRAERMHLTIETIMGCTSG